MEIVYRLDSQGWEASGLPPDARSARERLEAGNRMFASVFDPDSETARNVIPVPQSALGAPGVAPPQRPFAAVLGCADARAPIEIVFQQAFNDVFVVRVAGNVLGAEGLGSLAYAAEHLGDSLRLAVVLGHTGCGAVTAAVDAYLDAGAYPLGAFGPPLRAIVDRLLISVHTSARALQAVGADAVEPPGFRTALVETSVVVNAALTATTLQRELADRVPRELGVVFGVYDLATQCVGIPGFEEEGVGLADPPADASHLEKLAVAAASSRLAALNAR